MFRIFLAAFFCCMMPASWLLGEAISFAYQPQGKEKIQHCGMALCIGLNHVDSNWYQHWDGAMRSGENDMKVMAEIAESQHFQTKRLPTTKATRQCVLHEIENAANALKPGDIFLLTFAGHGNSRPELTQGLNCDALDKSWCLYDGELLHNELAAKWPKFNPKVRIVVISESCFSGTITKFRECAAMLTATAGTLEAAQRWQKAFEPLFSLPKDGPLNPASSPVAAMPSSVSKAVYKQKRAFFEAIAKSTPSYEQSVDAMKCTVLLISACQNNQCAVSDGTNGLFTKALEKVWDNGHFQGSYCTFHERILYELIGHQSPNYLVIGAPNVKFEREKPFTINPN
ncbi:MAG: caspase family protein [Planctomycetes bacterium]|nr:caspase family protein [Planctomycetota bacterium]